MSLVDYSALEQQIKDAPEPIVLPKGTEVELRIVSVSTGEDKNGNGYFMPFFDVPEEPLAKEISIFMTDLSDLGNLTEKQQLGALRAFRAFAEAFGLDYSQPFSFEDLKGLTGWAVLGIRKDDEYGERNTISKFVAPK